MTTATPGTHPSACPVCGLMGGTVVLEGHDHRRGLSGQFRVTACTSCDLARTDPWPDDPGAWYPDTYPQHGVREPATARLSRMALRIAARARGRIAPRVLGVLVPEADTGGALRPGSRILDVGAGTGGAVAALRAAGHHAFGVEPSARAVAVAQGRGIPGVVLGSLGDALDSGALPSQTWDVIRMSQVLEHVPDPLALLARLHGILAPEGRLVIGVPNLNSLARRATGGSWDGLEFPRHLVHYTRGSLRWVLGLAGFRVVTMRTTPLLGVLAGSLDALTAGGRRQRGWSDLLLVRVGLYPVELALGAAGGGDGLMVVAQTAQPAWPA